jgi:cardiolipin-specific phospholipase
VSPAGIPENPDSDVSSNGGGVEEEVQQSQAAVAPSSPAEVEADVNKMERVDSKEGKEAPKRMRAQSRMGSKSRTVLTYLWEKNFSPFGVIRSSLFFGPMMTGRYTSRRFGALPVEDNKALHAYCHAIFSSPGSSEYCLAHILAPMAYARLPMVSRIAAIPSTLPVSFVYGAVDWMDVNGGRDSCRRLSQAGNKLGSTFVVPNAGHHVYLDNPRAFDSLISRVLRGKVDGVDNS